MMEEEVVSKRKWMTREHFLDLVGATNLIPENLYTKPGFIAVDGRPVHQQALRLVNGNVGHILIQDRQQHPFNQAKALRGVNPRRC